LLCILDRIRPEPIRIRYAKPWEFRPLGLQLWEFRPLGFLALRTRAAILPGLLRVRITRLVIHDTYACSGLDLGTHLLVKVP